jgi:hypothetical protein
VATDRPADDALAVRKSLVGAWMLLECAELLQDGSKRLPLGDRARGQVIYTADGRKILCCAQDDERPDFTPNRDGGAPASLRRS